MIAFALIVAFAITAALFAMSAAMADAEMAIEAADDWPFGSVNADVGGGEA